MLFRSSGKTTLVNHILSNKRGIKFAVIVNDIGEVNIDADLIQKGGIVGKKDESLVALQNGCICCTLKMDLVEQIDDIMKQERFDYIVIEASGVCEPAPIAQTICSISSMGNTYGGCRLDCIVTVVDALRLQSEFSCGNDLTCKGIDEEDIENLIIQQIEFCNVVLSLPCHDHIMNTLNEIMHRNCSVFPFIGIVGTHRLTFQSGIFPNNQTIHIRIHKWICFTPVHFIGTPHFHPCCLCKTLCNVLLQITPLTHCFII